MGLVEKISIEVVDMDVRYVRLSYRTAKSAWSGKL
jgi:hypothetical protein